MPLIILATGSQQQDTRHRGAAEAVGEQATSRAAPDNHVVEGIARRMRSRARHSLPAGSHGTPHQYKIRRLAGVNPSGWTTGHGETDTLCGPQSEKAHEIPYRRHSTPFKLQLCQDIRNGVIGRRDAQRTYGVSADLIQLWLTQFDRGEPNDEEAEASVIRSGART